MEARRPRGPREPRLKWDGDGIDLCVMVPVDGGERFVVAWEAKDEARRALRQLLEADVAAVLPRQPPGRRQAQPPAAASRSSRIERIEQVLALCLRRAVAAVLDHQLDA